MNNNTEDEKKSLIEDESFIVVQGWMLNNLKLQGAELMVYATIWGFTQNQQDQWFTGTRQYLATWAGTSRVAIDKAIKRLMDKKLIEQKSVFKNKLKFNYYRIISKTLTEEADASEDEETSDQTGKQSLQGGVNNVDTPTGKQSLQGDVNKVDTPYKQSLQGCKQCLQNNNINIDIDNNIDNNINNNKEKLKKEKSPISDEHESILSSYTKNENLKEKIRDFIADRKERKKPVTVRSLQMLLKKLSELAQTDDQKIAVINQSIECGYQGFFELKGVNHDERRYNNSGITSYTKSAEKPGVPDSYREGLV